MYLERKLPEIRLDPHTLAIATYALALVNSAQANEFNTQLKTLVQDGGVGKFIVAHGGSILFPHILRFLHTHPHTHTHTHPDPKDLK